jgi:hypothetical protein
MDNLGTPYFKSLENSSEFGPELWALKVDEAISEFYNALAINPNLLNGA